MPSITLSIQRPATCPKKILIIYTSAGSGHLTAARALEQVLKNRPDQAEFLVVDALDYTNILHKKVYAESYLSLINHLPAVWGYFYNQADLSRRLGKLSVGKLVSLLDKINASRLFKLIKQYQPDHIISTHFLGAELLNTRPKPHISNSVVVTDYEAHSFWVHENVDHYFVATDQVRDSLVARGVSSQKISISGIPVRLPFTVKGDRAKLQKKWGVPSGRPTVLMMSGTFGVGQVTEIVRGLLTLPRQFNLVVISGKNSTLKSRLQKLNPPSGTNYQVLGYVEEVPELMDISDLIVTKAGGLTVTECLVKGLPMIMTDPIPGQEEFNADYVIELGAGLKAPNLFSLQSKVGRLLESPELLAGMAQKARLAGKPHASHEIIDKVLQMS